MSPLEITIHPNIGNLVSQISFQGREMLYSPYISKNLMAGSTLEGIPFLYPFANRLEEDSIPLEYSKHRIPENTKGLRRDSNGLLLHGILYYKKGWEPEVLRNSQLDSYYEARFEYGEDLLEIFPFTSILKQELELEGNTLTFTLSITNTSSKPMPLSVGYHPYFFVPERWKKNGKIFTNGTKYYETNEKLLPTGKLLPSAKILAKGELENVLLDHNFTEFHPKEKPFSELILRNRKIRLELINGFDHILLFTPKGKDFVCMEPMVGPVNAFFLYQKGIYKNLKFIEPNQTWKGSFRLLFDSSGEDVLPEEELSY